MHLDEETATRAPHLEHTTRLLVDETRDALDATTARQTTNGRLRDTLQERSQKDDKRGPLTWMLSRNTLRWRLAPPLPRPLPPLPRPDIVAVDQRV